jgi:CHAT domain-containing protein/tetratricopeptide (TPR) repeat protein
VNLRDSTFATWFVAFGVLFVLLDGSVLVASSRCRELIRRAEESYLSARFDTSIALGREVLSCIEQNVGGSDTATASVQLLIGKYQFAAERYAAADSSTQQAANILEGFWGSCHPMVLRAKVRVAEAERFNGEVVEADSLLREIIALVAVHNEDPEITADALTQLGIGYRVRNEFDSARSCFDRALSIYGSLDGDFRAQKQIIEISKGRILIWESRYADGELQFEDLINDLSPACALDSLALAESRYNLGQAHRMLGKYADAETDEKSAINIRRRILGKFHYLVAEAVCALAAVYQDQGNYYDGKRLLEESLTIFRVTVGEENYRVAAVLKSLARLNNDLGRFAEAESLYAAAVSNRERALSPVHVGTAQVLAEAAAFHLEHHQYSQAEQMLQRALPIFESAFDANHDGIAASLDGLGRICFAGGRYGEALVLFERARSICRDVFGIEGPSYALCLESIASVCVKQHRYDSAGALHEEATSIMRKALSDDHPLLARCLESKSAFEFIVGDTRAALEDAENAYYSRKKSFSANNRVLSEADALRFSNWMHNSADNSLTCFFESAERDSAVIERICDIVVSTKGEVSDEIFERRRSLKTTGDPTILRTMSAYTQVRRQLSNAYVQDSRSIKSGDISALLSKTSDSLEAELAMRSVSFRKMRERDVITAAKVASLIPRDGALIEYMKYNRIDFQRDERTPHYLAIVIKPGRRTTIVELGAARPIDSMVGLYLRQMGSAAEQWPDLNQETLRKTNEVLENLYRKIFLPLHDYVKNTELVLVSPDGALNLVSFGTLKNSEGRYLIEETRIHYLSTTRELLRLQERGNRGSGLLVLGDPDFDANSNQRTQARDTIAMRVASDQNLGSGKVLRSACDSLQQLKVPPLPYTRREVMKIADFWKSRDEGPAEVLLGAAASEERFKRDAPGKSALHLATHGFSRLGRCNNNGNETEESTAESSRNPLLLSGLLLAGANSTRSQGGEAESEDGFLTADEVAALNLDGTQWVVLSACGTGLGEVENGEGVYGLRRAFQIAGARTVVSSLWQVPDKETESMMETLYFARQSTLDEAMQKMALRQIDEIRKRNLPDHPYTWGAFIAAGDWRVDR